MNNRVRILHLEDDALDAELIQVTLEAAGIVCQIKCVQDRDEFSQALRQGSYDIILADYRLPSYDGVSALRLAQELRPELPFIFVSGTLGEDAAIDGLTHGATDYVLKQKLSRLAPAVARALRETENRRERLRAESALRESEAKFSTAFRLSPAALSVSTAENHIYVDVNESFLEWTGYTHAEVIGHTSLELELWVNPDQNREFRRMLHDHGSVHNFEYVYHRKDGAVRYALLSAALITINGVLCVLAQSIDITDHKQAEEALKASEQKLRMIFEAVEEALALNELVVDEQGEIMDYRILEVNPAFERDTQLNREQAIGQTATQLYGMSTDYITTFWEMHRHDTQAVKTDMCVEQTINQKRIKAWKHISTSIPVNGKFVTSYLDITDLKNAENALRESEQKFRSFVSESSEGFTLANEQGEIIEWNHAQEKITGLSAQQTLGQAFWDVQYNMLLPELRTSEHYERAKHIALDALQTGRSPLFNNVIEAEILRQDRERCFIQQTIFPIPTDKGYRIGSVTRDITTRKHAEARILRLNRLYATLSHINEAIVHVRNRETLFHEICRVAVGHGQFCLAWIGLLDEETHRVNPIAFAGEEQGYLTEIAITYQDEPLGHSPTGVAIREGKCVLCQDIAADQRMRPWRDQSLSRGYRSTAAVPFWQHGHVVGALTVYAAELQSFDPEDEQLLDEIGQDISYALDALEQETRRRQAEADLNRLNAELEQRVNVRTAELARAHEHLRAILDTAGEGVVFTDIHGTIEYINPAMERLTGYQTAETIGRNPRMWKSDRTPAAIHRHMWSAITSGEIWQGELINRRKDGTLYDAALTTAPLTNSEDKTVGYVGVQRDITRQKELDRMKDQFVSNVSHELRTPLTNILLHVQLLESGNPDRRNSYLQTLRRETERLRKMIEDLLDLSRLDRNVISMQRVSADLNRLLEQLIIDRVTLAEQRSLTLAYVPTPDLPLISTDTSKLIQVASNLLTNALNYTPAGGSVKVSTETRQHAGQTMVTFTVCDTGPGVSAEDLPHLFERFYRGTAGRQASAPGTGLGLAISQDIMKRLDGRITVESAAGHGAAFTVWLPAD